MDANSPNISKLIITLRHAREIIQHVSTSQLVKYLQLPLSTVMALPMLTSDHPQPRLIALVLLFLAILLSVHKLFIPTIIDSQHSTSKESKELSTSAIRALSKFLIPTTSIWPQYYLDAAHTADFSNQKRVILRLETVIRDIKQGRIELRQPVTDLPLLFKGRLQLDGWSFDLDLGLKDRAKMLALTVSDEISFFPDEAYPKPHTFGEDTTPTIERKILENFCALYYDTNDNIIKWPSMDTVPRAFVQKVIRKVQGTLNTKPVTQNTSVLLFTTTETGVSTFDKTFAFAALPFSHVEPGCQKQSLARSTRTSAPLFTRLPDVLAQLTSGPHPLNVLSLSNASAMYANALDAHATTLEQSDDARRAYIEVAGVQGWREERLYARWEAALLRAGLLTRWVILLEMKK